MNTLAGTPEKSPNKAAVIACIGALMIATTEKADAALYYVTDLGGFGGEQSYAYGINDNGQIAGTAQNVNGVFEPFYSDGTTLNRMAPPGTDGQGTRINNNGQAIGTFISENGRSHAFMWQNGNFTDLGTLNPNNTGGSGANSINDSGVIVGHSQSADFQTFTGIKYNGTMVPIGGNSRSAFDINNRGTIVGQNNDNRAIIQKDGSMLDLGSQGGSESLATRVNESDQVVGWYTYHAGSGERHAFLWEGGLRTDLGTLGGSSYATSINDDGQIVGYSVVSTPTGLRNHGAIWENGSIADINTLTINSTLEIIVLNDVNNNGSMVGFGYDANDLVHPVRAVLLTIVPEPQSPVLLALGAAYLARRKRENNTVSTNQ